jgi:hypothetical protein
MVALFAGGSQRPDFDKRTLHFFTWMNWPNKLYDADNGSDQKMADRKIRCRILARQTARRMILWYKRLMGKVAVLYEDIRPLIKRMFLMIGTVPMAKWDILRNV